MSAVKPKRDGSGRVEAQRLIALAMDLLDEQDEIARDYLGHALNTLDFSNPEDAMSAKPSKV